MELLIERVMPTFTIKNIPDTLYERLKQFAQINRRSINNEIISCIEWAVSDDGPNTEELLAKAQKLRRKTVKHPISAADFNDAKQTGRL